ncbi:Argonaute siRNA chaperone complex subunit Arb1-domain-containing protein [Pseudomassariella vexata]|uniref:Argonaute siRNA chaperone complex subunit Arb1-domain-containing protein n=1 Tax=Pseudomassariella vexata TaxID=1141098 RepID=A0A1Y2DZZ5_9PEZI|nr:Argonaute siRNA chaperone complex subunit Arb1-domain-containing protein [Pseudomassariella vexata]ORY64799.1 Argonaute siRNA chaperone complex subunit Arb1-domain-containing protein [Pseudomassariella vexata]
MAEKSVELPGDFPFIKVDGKPDGTANDVGSAGRSMGSHSSTAVTKSKVNGTVDGTTETHVTASISSGGESRSSINEESVNAHVVDADAAGVTEVQDDDQQAVASIVSGLSELPNKKKKKRSKRPGKSTRKISGFEPNFADVPVTPDEYKEERGIYASHVPFPERIEQCIQRYRARRRWDCTRNFIFDRYLLLGGIDSTQRQFTGMDTDTIKLSTADEIRQMTARDVIHYGTAGSKFYDIDDHEQWDVDFVGVVKGFLSREVPQVCPRGGDSNANNKEAASLVTNFLNYIMMHDVCPEYKSQLMQAREICHVAPTEIRHANELFVELPGSFNAAARFLFCEGGIYRLNEPTQEPAAVDKTSKPDGDMEEDESHAEESYPFTQFIRFRLTVLDKIPDPKLKDIITKGEPTQIRIISTKTETYQVVDIERIKKSHKKTLEKLLDEMGYGGKVKPAGLLVLCPSIIEHAYSNLPRPEEVDFSKHLTESFFIDDDMLAKFKKGMRMKLVICELNIGLSFIKDCIDITVSFDTFLPQSLMHGWKDPVENERPAPSVENPNAEEKAMDPSVKEETVNSGVETKALSTLPTVEKE